MDSALGSHVMRLSDLRGKTIKSLDGEALGRVHEVHCDKLWVVALMVGPGSFIERWTAKGAGRRIPWECVRKVDADQIIVTLERPKRGASASRSRQGTLRPSGRRSKR
jgi:sporulation protein YlmC with PRC-barrel domain